MGSRDHGSRFNEADSGCLDDLRLTINEYELGGMHGFGFLLLEELHGMSYELDMEKLDDLLGMSKVMANSFVSRIPEWFRCH